MHPLIALLDISEYQKYCSLCCTSTEDDVDFASKINHIIGEKQPDQDGRLSTKVHVTCRPKIAHQGHKYQLLKRTSMNDIHIFICVLDFLPLGTLNLPYIICVLRQPNIIYGLSPTNSYYL